MNTPVKFEIAKLLKEKGCEQRTKSYTEDAKLVTVSLTIRRFIPEKIYYPAPTIAEVVMWLCEEYGIWTVVNVDIMGSWYFEHFDLKEKRNAQFKPTDTHYDSPTEAYEAAINYTLNNLI